MTVSKIILICCLYLKKMEVDTLTEGVNKMKVSDIILPQNEVDDVEETDFEGSSVYNIIGMYYLSHKEPKNVCVIYGEPYRKDNGRTIKKEHKHDSSCVLLPPKVSLIPEEQTSVSLRWLEKEKRISVPEPAEKFWANFSQCDSKRFVALPFGFTCNSYGHANYLLFDKQKKTLERFESFGKVTSRCLNNKLVNSKIVELFKTNLRGTEYENFEYIEPLEFLPEENVQTIQENETDWKKRAEKNPVGFCSVWSLWYIDLRTLNPDVEPHLLVQTAIKKIRTLEKQRGGSFTDFIRRYSLIFVNLLNQWKKDDGDGGGNGKKQQRIFVDGRKRFFFSRRRKRIQKSRPSNPALYEKAKKEVYAIYRKPSAYRSGALVKRYKQLGGKYTGKKRSLEGLSRWFKEEWGDVGHKAYPVYRPSRRVSKKTPLLAREIEPRNLRRQISLKQKIKGSKNLPRFISKKIRRSKRT